MADRQNMPVYLFTGFLEAGKTKFIQETLENADFDTGENTLVIVCEEGVEEFEKDKFKVRNVSFEYIDDVSDINEKNFSKISKKHKAKRVIVEYNGMWTLDKLYDAMPDNWTVYQEMMFADSNTFENYNANLNVPCDFLEDYQYDPVFGSFKYFICMGAESDNTDSDEVVVTPGTTDVTIVWPTEEDADTYSIVIYKDGSVFCTLTFNADGQLLNITFAPSRDGNNHPAQYAEQAANGYRFTVTNLESGTKYSYNIEVKDASNQTIKSYSGEFTTQSTTAVDNISTNNANIQKIIRNGQLLILRDGKTYNTMGAEIR